uniref:Putative secreted protein n=1 Tax=Ixodes ricinus TaxID=34613 RepID=A0A6B0UMS8_IXORI
MWKPSLHCSRSLLCVSTFMNCCSSAHCLDCCHSCFAITATSCPIACTTAFSFSEVSSCSRLFFRAVLGSSDSCFHALVLQIFFLRRTAEYCRTCGICAMQSVAYRYWAMLGSLYSSRSS